MYRRRTGWRMPVCFLLNCFNWAYLCTVRMTIINGQNILLIVTRTVHHCEVRHMKKRVSIFCIIVFLSGLGLLLYPFISNLVNQHHATQVIDKYDDRIQDMKEGEIDVIKEAAKKYNEQLKNAVSVDKESEDDAISYVDISGENKVIGYIVIPKIDVNLPIYSGTSDTVLKKGVGHMSQTSYPLGGESTHCVLTGHRGLPSAVLFTDLDKLELGDEFYLHVMDEILAYRVDQIRVIEPNESEGLGIVPGEDYCTLATCTPYAINTHRLLVRGTRVEYTGEREAGTNSQLQSGAFAKRIIDVWPWLLAAFAAVVFGETVLFVWMVRRKKKEKEE